MTTATDALNTKIDDLTSAVTDALSQVESEVATIKANTPTADDSAIVNASADRIGSLSATIRDALTKARGELAKPSASTPVSASTAPAVALAGVPETPASNAGMASAGPAVPSVDSSVTADSPNKETSSPAPEPSGLTASVSGI